MKRLIVLLAFLVASPALAADYYFSDCHWTPQSGQTLAPDLCTWAGEYGTAAEIDYACPSEGQPIVFGSVRTPYCLSPESTSIGNCVSQGNPSACCTGADTGTCGDKRNSFASMMDAGAGPTLTTELIAGDTVYLCAGACDGQGTATYYLQASSGTTWFTALVDNVTVRTYPGETVILSGDSDGDVVADSGELDTAMRFGSGISGWTIGSGDKSLIFQQFGASGGSGPIVFNMDNNAGGFTFDGIIVRNTNKVMWSGLSVYAAGCRSANGSPNETGGYLFYDASRNGADNTTRNSRFYNLCGVIWRTIAPVAGATIIEDNEGWNGSQISNAFTETGHRFRRNRFSDFYSGVGIEQRMQDAIVEDNEISCPGTYRTSLDGRCVDGIYLDDGDNPGEGGVITHDVIIRRNKLWGATSGSFQGSTVGWFMNPIRVDFSTDTTANVTVENNMVWHHWGWANDCFCIGGGNCGTTPPCTPGGGHTAVPDSEWAGPAIFVRSNRTTASEIVVQNNTIYDSQIGILLHGTATGKAYTARDNLIVRSRKGTSAKPAIAATEWAAPNSVIQNNLIDRNSRTNAAEQISWIGSGGGGGTYYTCSTQATLGFPNGSGNACGAASLKLCDSQSYCTCGSGFPNACTSNPVSWDLLLSGPQQAVDFGVTAATEDIEEQDRPYIPPEGSGLTDCGADEFYPPQPPAPPPSAPVVNPVTQ